MDTTMSSRLESMEYVDACPPSIQACLKPAIHISHVATEERGIRISAMKGCV